MTTMTDQEIDLVGEEFWDTYVPGNTATETKKLPTDGRYLVKMPDQIPDGAFQVKEDATGQKYLSITLDPVTLVTEDEATNGYQVRYLRVSTKPETNFQKDGESWKAVGTLNASSAADVLLNFGSEDRPRTVEEWKTAFRQLEGRTSPSPFYLVWNGYDKAASGKAKYLKSKDFAVQADGTRPNYIDRLDVTTGASRRVWANLTLGRRGAAPR